MMVRTHVVTGIVTALAAARISDSSLPESGLLLLGGMAGCLLPDIDHPQSWLGRRLPFISRPLSALVGHRGITHSLIAVVLVLLGLLAAASHWGGDHPALATVLGLGISLGYASHLLGDWLTPSGIPLLWPNRQRFRSPLTFLTGGTFETVLGGLLWLLALYFALALLHWIEPLRDTLFSLLGLLMQGSRQL